MLPIVVSALAAILVTACSAATVPPAPASPMSAPSSSAAPHPNPSAPPSRSATPSMSSSPVVVGQAPRGAWSAIRWIQSGALPFTSNEITVRGWSGGFIALEQSPGSDDKGNELLVIIRAAQSTDGLRWSAPTTLETGFAGNLAIASIVESPGGLLALAYPYGDTCGGPESVAAMWSSSDGLRWHRLAMPNDFGSGQVRTVAGGPAGFVALGVRSDSTQAIWTSPDGRAWTRGKLPRVSSGTLALDEVASVEGGFVLVGSVLGEEGCGGPGHVRFATWFSRDGSAWTRTNLPGAVPDPTATVHVQPLLGRVLAYQILPGDETSPLAWTSADGQSWTSVGAVSSDIVWASVSDGSHTIQALLPDDGIGAPILTALDESGARAELRQDGDPPATTVDGPGWIYAVGPTGVLAVTTDGRQSRLGIPR